MIQTVFPRGSVIEEQALTLGEKRFGVYPSPHPHHDPRGDRAKEKYNPALTGLGW